VLKQKQTNTTSHQQKEFPHKKRTKAKAKERRQPCAIIKTIKRPFVRRVNNRKREPYREKHSKFFGSLLLHFFARR